MDGGSLWPEVPEWELAPASRAPTVRYPTSAKSEQ